MGVEGVILIVSVLLGAGGLTAFFQARSEAPKLAAEAHSQIIRDLVAEIDRLKKRIKECEELASGESNSPVDPT